jgi:hypothetical protein
MKQASVKEVLMEIVLEVANQVRHPLVGTMLPLLLRPLEGMPEHQAREVALMILKYSQRLEEALQGNAVELDRP